MTATIFHPSYVSNPDRFIGKVIKGRVGGEITKIRVASVRYQDRKVRNSGGSMIAMPQTIFEGELVA